MVESPAEMDRLISVNLADDIATQIRRYVVLDDDQADTVALWIMHAWTIDAFFTTGRLYINSPEPECGKTQLLRTVQFLLDDVINAASISAPVLYRRLATGTPAFLVDEIDTTIGAKSAKESESQSALLGILNSGYARGATVQRVNRTNMGVEEFPTFCPVALAGISSHLSDAFMSRTIPIDLRRKLRHEKADRWIDGPDLRSGFEEIRERVRTWAGLYREALKGRVIDYPDELSDRQIECWGPMIAIADQLGGEWPARVKVAYKRTAARPSETEGAGHRMLVDVREVFEDRDWIGTKVLVDRLNSLEGADYATWNRGSGLTEKTLGLKLDPYRIRPMRRQIEGEQTRGYARDQFEDAWSRYIQPCGKTSLSLFDEKWQPGNRVVDTRADSETLTPSRPVVAGSDLPVAGSNGELPDPSRPGNTRQPDPPEAATTPPPSGNGEHAPDYPFDDADHEEWARQFETEEP